MPSAASAKIEKRSSSEVVFVNNNTPIRQVITAVEHKIRNLEKRKGKLESYRDLQKSGKDLTTDQKIAVSKYDEVTQCLDFARELFKQVHACTAMWEKDQKKVIRKETAARIQNEVTKVKEVLIIQDTLLHLQDEQAREDFLTGSNGAAKLTSRDLELLNKLYEDSTLKRLPGSDMVTFIASAQKAADHLISTIDGKPKPFCDTNYERIRSILQAVQSSGYFDKKFLPSNNCNSKNSVEGTDDIEESVENEINTDIKNENAIQQGVDNNFEQSLQQQSPQQQNKFVTEAPSAAAVPAPNFPTAMTVATVVPGTVPQVQAQLGPTVVASPQLSQTLTAIVPGSGVLNASTVGIPQAGATASQNPLIVGHIAPTVRAVEQSYFKQHQYVQQLRPISEVIGTGNFFFLQDSEIDSPDKIPTGGNFTMNIPQQVSPNVPPPQLQQQQAQTILPAVQPQSVMQQQQQTPLPTGPIPTQTFTNQSFQNIVPPPIFPNMKPTPTSNVSPGEIPQSNIQGFVTSVTNATIPLSIPPQNVMNNMVHQQQQQQSSQNVATPSPLQQQQQQQQPNSGHLISNALPIVQQFQPIPQFQQQPQTSPIMIHQNHQQHQNILPTSPPQSNSSDQVSNDDIKQQQPQQPPIIIEEQITINEWNASGNSNNNKKDDSNEWADQQNSESLSKEWNNDHQHHHQNNNSDNYGGSWHHDNGYNRRGYNGSGGNRSQRSSGGVGGGTTGSYRNRSSNSYQQNGGASSRSTFYRNNDPNYYQNQNGSGSGTGSSGGVAGYNSGKHDNYNSNGPSYKARTGGNLRGMTRNHMTDRNDRPNSSQINRNSDRMGSGQRDGRDLRPPRQQGSNSTSGNGNGSGGGSGYQSRMKPQTE